MAKLPNLGIRTGEKVHPSFRHPDYPMPRLHDPHMQFDLEAETDRMRKEHVWKSESKNAITLAKYDDLRIVLIAMMSGERMKGHKAYGSMAIHALTGKLRLHLPDKTVDVSAGNLLTLGRDLPYEVEALKNCSFLLSISWAKAA